MEKMKDEKEMFDPKSKRYSAEPVKREMLLWLSITCMLCLLVVIVVAYAPTFKIWFNGINPVYQACFAIAISIYGGYRLYFKRK